MAIFDPTDPPVNLKPDPRDIIPDDSTEYDSADDFPAWTDSVRYWPTDPADQPSEDDREWYVSLLAEAAREAFDPEGD